MIADYPNSRRPIAITTGEPAGVGPELIARLLQERRVATPLKVIGDADLLIERAQMLGLDLFISNEGLVGSGMVAGVEQVPLNAPSTPGNLDQRNVGYVMETLRRAADGCLAGIYAGLVTAPVQKSVILETGQRFSGHTEFFAEQAGSKTPVMMLVRNNFRVALVTIHLPLVEVPSALTADLLDRVLRVIDHDLKTRFGIDSPVIGVCGLNPHAGESGYLGTEEAEVITPVLERLSNAGLMLKGPFPADAVFRKPTSRMFDVIVAMYHDQGLPVIKHEGFGHSVNVTLGLPFIRTSVDHGTALDIAGTGQAKIDSLVAALELAENLAHG
jgi:4-hydroxythreonine-4-phosphate dehydrogenase